MKLASILNNIISEVGEGTAKPYNYTSIHGIQRSDEDNGAHDTLKFVTEDGDTYEVMVAAFWGDNYLAKKPVGPHFTIDFWVKKRGSDTRDTAVVVNKGRLFRVMATVIQIAEEFMDLVDYKKNDINQLIVSPTKTKGEFDDRRAKLYMAYIKKHLPIKDIKYDGHEIVATLKESIDLSEGVYDPGVLKAVFLAGGPGSGKTYMAQELFSFNAERIGSDTPSGLKFVNTDPAFEFYLKKQGVDPKTLRFMTSDQFDKVTMGPDSPREKAKKLRNMRQKFFEKERLGMIIDGTGDDFEKIKKKRERLEELGYDTYMVFVNTDMDVALQRNADRERSLPDDLVTDIWKAVQNNLGKFARLFGQGQFSIVDNTEYAPLSREVDKEVQRFVRQPIRNPIGKKWQEAAIEMKKR